jgi:hypothetical protein
LCRRRNNRHGGGGGGILSLLQVKVSIDQLQKVRDVGMHLGWGFGF